MRILTTDPSPQDGFSNSKIIRSIRSLKNSQFSGKLTWMTLSNQKKWVFYFSEGYLCYATGGTHPVRRWVRSLAVYYPEMEVNITQIQQNLHKIAAANFAFGWEYYLLELWIEQHRITQSQAAQIIQSIFLDVLLQLSQAGELTYQAKQISTVPQPIVCLDEQEVASEVQQLGQKLWNYNLGVNLLNKSPTIKNPEQLKSRVSAEVGQALLQFLDGEKTLLDLAAQSKLDVVRVACSLLPYFQANIVELIDVPDLPQPIQLGGSRDSVSKERDKPLIACIDDSTIVCWTMEKLVTTAGYRFIGITDGLRAITALLKHKPDLIFLDVFMPGTNGYEICKNLRKAPSFRHTPIVFLTGLDGVVDQVRARLAGASEFLSKPIDGGKVLSVVSQYLSSESITPGN